MTITFAVEIDNPLPAGVTQISNQGLVTGTNFPSAQTDDPAGSGTSDPTVIAVTGIPPVVEVPALGTWGALALILLLAGLGLRRLLPKSRAPQAG